MNPTDENETLEDIVAWIRKVAETRHDAFLNDPNEDPFAEAESRELNKIADRVEVAWVREREAVSKPRFRLEFDQKALGQEGISVRDILRNLIVSAPETADEEPRVYETDKVSEEMREFAEDIKHSTDGIAPDVASHLCAVIRNFAAKYDMAAEDESASYQHTIRLLNDAVGNAAAMREALAKILGIADHLQMRYEVPELAAWEISELKRIANAALSSPPRQCDIGTAEEQVERWRRYCSSHRSGASCDGCPLETDDSADCYATWAQMPYEEEGGAK